MTNFEIIIGVHSITEALNNPARKVDKLVGVKDSITDIRKKIINFKEVEPLICETTPHDVQEQAKKLYIHQGFEFQRIPSNIFAVVSRLPEITADHLYKDVQAFKAKKIFCLDQVTDVHNAAAIMRTAAFFNVDYLLVPGKGSFGITPSFIRIASGAYEHVKILHCSSLPRVITKLIELKCQCIGFSEHSEDLGPERSSNDPIVLVVGAEDVGISHAVLRQLSHVVSLNSLGKIKSLNVSVASGLAMQRFFN